MRRSATSATSISRRSTIIATRDARWRARRWPTIRRCACSSSASTARRSTSISADGPRGCYTIGTAATVAAVDDEVRAFLADRHAQRPTSFLRGQIEKAKERGEIARDADTAALAYLATATLHTLAVRSRAGIARKELDALADAAIKVICATRVTRPATHVNALHMSWSRGPRGYHHGNLKEALIRAALELIAEKGPAGFTFAEAARWAGVSPAAPYRHFRDRDESAGRRRAARLRAVRDALTQAWDDGRPDPLTAFERLGKAYLAFARTEPAYYSAMFEAGIAAEYQPGTGGGRRPRLRGDAHGLANGSSRACRPASVRRR